MLRRSLPSLSPQAPLSGAFAALLCAATLSPAGCSGDSTGTATQPLTQPLPRLHPRPRSPLQWWFRQRAYPAGTIPRTAYSDALSAFRSLTAPPRARTPRTSSLGWTLIGPAPLATDVGTAPPNPNWSPVSGRLGAFAVDPSNANTLYAGGALGGVWKSADRGKSWAPISDNQASLAISAIVIDPNAPSTLYVGTGNADLYAGYYGQGLLRSIDGGKTWDRPAGDKFNSLSISRLVLDPASGDLYVGTQFGSAGWGDFCTNTDANAPGQGLYRSSDGGKTWSLLYPGTIVDLDVDLSVTPRRLYIDELATGVHRSLDGGKGWEDAKGLPMNTDRAELGISPSQPSIIYAGVDRLDHAEVYVSTDYAKSFTQIPGAPDYCERQCSYDNVVLVAPDDPGTVYLGGATCSVWKMTNALSASPASSAISLPGGDCGKNDENWTKGFVHADAHVLTLDPTDPKVLYVGSDGGLARTEDSGKSWTRLNNGLATLQLYAACADPNDPTFTLGAAQDNGPMLRTAPSLTWAGITTGDGTGCAIDASDSKRVAVATQYGSLFVSADRFDADFQYVFETQDPCMGLAGCGDRVAFVPPLAAHPTQPGTLYIGTYRVWRSIEGGKAGSFHPMSDDLTAGKKSVQCVTDKLVREDDTLSFIAAARADPKVVYTGSAAGVMSATFDEGASWTTVSKAPLPTRYLSGIAVDPLDPKTVFASFSGFSANTPTTPGHVFRSFDGGATWEKADIGMDTPVNTLLAHPKLQGILYAGTDFGALATNDYGNTWAVLGGLPNTAVYSLSFRDSKPSLVAATYGRSVWEVPFIPRLQIQPTEISLTAQEWDESVATSLEVMDAEGFGSTLHASIDTPTSWLSALPQKIEVAGADTAGVTVKAVTVGMAPGTYEGSVTLTLDGPTPSSVPVHLKIVPRSVTPPPNPPPSGLVGGGGCGCSAVGSEMGAGSVLAVVALGALVTRRRRRGKVAPR